VSSGKSVPQQEGGSQSLRCQPESQARKKRRREERKAKAKAGSSAGAASSLAAVVTASLPSGAEALLSWTALQEYATNRLTLFAGIALLLSLVTFLAADVAARSAPGSEGREPPPAEDHGWDFFYFLFLAGLASIGRTAADSSPSVDKVSQWVWGEGSSGRTHHSCTSPPTLSSVAIVFLTLVVIGLALLQRGGTNEPLLTSNRGEFLAGARELEKNWSFGTLRGFWAHCRTYPQRSQNQGFDPTPGYGPVRRGPSKARQLHHEYKELRVAHLQGGAEWKAETLLLFLARLAETTQKSYLSQWRWWELFCARRGVSPWRGPAYSASEEGRLAAIRAFHITSGLPDPFSQLPRVALVVAGLKKKYGTKERRRAVTPAMLQWLHSHLHGGVLSYAEVTLQWGALCLAFFFLLRASEYLDTGYHSPLRGLRGRDLRLSRGGKPCSLRDFEEADELTVFIRGSKTDVYNRGEYRNHYKTGLLLCPVTATTQLFKSFPLRFAGGPEEDELLFRDLEGKPLPRALVSILIRKAAEALQEPEGALGTHSLRFGGASALWAAFGDTALVKPWGRWTSESFQTYIWARARQQPLGYAWPTFPGRGAFRAR
ncbi:unnamed protein product, partial [Symbiodinium necroappetens]